jgi:RsiW-degrading membrane proteinase PrsW (M82 family)
MSRESQDTGLPPAVAAMGRIDPERDRWPELAGIAALAFVTTGVALMIVVLVSSEEWGYCTGGVDPGACAGSHRLIATGWLVAAAVTAATMVMFVRVGLVDGRRRYEFTGNQVGRMVLVGFLATGAMLAYLVGYAVGSARPAQAPPRSPRPGRGWPVAACLAVVIGGCGPVLGLQVDPVSRSCEDYYGTSACAGITGLNLLIIFVFYTWVLASAVRGLIVGLREGRRRYRFAQARWLSMVLVGVFSPLALALYGVGYGIGRMRSALSPDLSSNVSRPLLVPATPSPSASPAVDTRTGDSTWRTSAVAHRRGEQVPVPAVDGTGRMTIDRGSRPLLAVAGLFSGLYATQMLIDITRPRRDPREPLIGILGPYPASVKVTFWLLVTGWLVAIGILVCWRVRGGPPILRLVMAAALLLPFTASPVSLLYGHPVALLACLPTTGLALLGVYRLQRLRRVPLRPLFAVFCWGALFATGFGAAMNIWTLDYGTAYFGGGTDPLQPLRTMHNAYTATFASAGLFEELGKGTGILLAYLLFRRYFDGVVAGVVLGAAAGLGFNLVESVEYITAANGASAGFQFWGRQSVGIMAAHTAFSAVLGAAFGVARRLDDPRLRRIAIGCGYLGSAGTHFANDALLRWWGHAEPRGWSAHPTLDMLLVTPLVLAVLQGPFVVLYLLLLRLGLRRDGHALAHVMRVEADTGAGALTEPEIPVLLTPATRLWLHVTMFRRYGWAGYRAMSRLHTAQYDLAARLAHGPDDGPAESTLRGAVLARRQRLAAVVGAVR